MSDGTLIAEYDTTVRKDEQKREKVETRALLHGYRAADDMEMKQTINQNPDAQAHGGLEIPRNCEGDAGDNGNSCYRFESYRKYVPRFVTGLFLVGYLIYTGFALYLNPGDSVFVCILACFVFIFVINSLSGGRITRTLRQCWRKRPQPKRKTALWIRRYVVYITHSY